MWWRGAGRSPHSSQCEAWRSQELGAECRASAPCSYHHPAPGTQVVCVLSTSHQASSVVYGVPATKLQLVLLSVLTCFSVDKTCEAKAVQGERLARVCYMNFSALQVSQFATERPMPASVPHFTNTGRIPHKTTPYGVPQPDTAILLPGKT